MLKFFECPFLSGLVLINAETPIYKPSAIRTILDAISKICLYSVTKISIELYKKKATIAQVKSAIEAPRAHLNPDLKLTFTLMLIMMIAIGPINPEIIIANIKTEDRNS